MSRVLVLLSAFLLLFGVVYCQERYAFFRPYNQCPDNIIESDITVRPIITDKLQSAISKLRPASSVQNPNDIVIQRFSYPLMKSIYTANGTKIDYGCKLGSISFAQSTIPMIYDSTNIPKNYVLNCNMRAYSDLAPGRSAIECKTTTTILRVGQIVEASLSPPLWYSKSSSADLLDEPSPGYTDIHSNVEVYSRLVVDEIDYDEINGNVYFMTLFENEMDTPYSGGQLSKRYSFRTSYPFTIYGRSIGFDSECSDIPELRPHNNNNVIVNDLISSESESAKKLLLFLFYRSYAVAIMFCATNHINGMRLLHVYPGVVGIRPKLIYKDGCLVYADRRSMGQWYVFKHKSLFMNALVKEERDGFIINQSADSVYIRSVNDVDIHEIRQEFEDTLGYYGKHFDEEIFNFSKYLYVKVKSLLSIYRCVNVFRDNFSSTRMYLEHEGHIYRHGHQCALLSDPFIDHLMSIDEFIIYRDKLIGKLVDVNKLNDNYHFLRNDDYIVFFGVNYEAGTLW